MAAPAPLWVIGLDGADWRLLRVLFARGVMPHLRAICRGGARAPLLSTLPIATLPAWTSWLTAAPPAVHGVADMLVREPHSYGLAPASGALRALPTCLAELDAQGLAACCLGMPGTFPPEQLAHGLCVAGFDAPGAAAATRAAVWPPAFWPTLQRLGGWRYATFNEQRRRDRAGLQRAADALCADLARKERVIHAALARRPWDLFCVHLQASDTAGHHLWASFDTTSPRYDPARACDALPRVFARLDALIGRLRTAMPAHARLVVLSDHGMGGASDVAVYLNRLLERAGALHFASPARRLVRRGAGRALRAALAHLPRGAMGHALRHLPGRPVGALLAAARGAAVDYRRSAAFADELDYTPSIWFNRVGALPHGHLDDDAAAHLVATLTPRLLALRDPRTGAPLVRAVHPRATLPDGPHRARLPDLVIEPAFADGYRPSFLASEGPGDPVACLAPAQHAAPRGAGLPGAHRRTGIFVACGPGIAPGRLPRTDIATAGAAVYPLLGVPAPTAAHGVLPAAWHAALAAGAAAPQDADRRRAIATDAMDPTVRARAYSPQQSAALLQRLTDLGYM